MTTITNFNSEFDPNVVNDHQPKPEDIIIELYATGKHMVKVINLPFGYKEEVADELSLTEAWRVKRAMLRVKPFGYMMELARIEIQKMQGPRYVRYDADGNAI